MGDKEELEWRLLHLDQIAPLPSPIKGQSQKYLPPKIKIYQWVVSPVNICLAQDSFKSVIKLKEGHVLLKGMNTMCISFSSFTAGNYWA